MPRLSEIARHLVVPRGIVTTGWPATRGRLHLLGMDFDPWQEQAARIALGKREDGTFATGAGAIVWSVPRQVGKTFAVGGMVIARCLAEPGTLVLWTAHRGATSDETFADMRELVSRRKLRPFLADVRSPIRSANGQQRIMFANGSRIAFGAREHGFGRGFKKVSIVILDEAQILSSKAMDDMIPATAAADNPLVFLIGTPPKPSDPSEVFTLMRTMALNGEEPDVCYLEFAADPDTDPQRWPTGHIDWGQVGKANPAFGVRTNKAAITRILKLLGPESFRREVLGIWDCDRSLANLAVIQQELWDQLATTSAPSGGTAAYAIRFSPDGAVVALAAARRPVDGPVFAEIIDERPAYGIGWIVDWLGARWRDAAAIVVDGKAGAAPLADQLTQAGVWRSKILLPTADQVIGAHATLLELAATGGVAFSAQDGLHAETQRAGKRPIGYTGGWGFKSLDGKPIAGLEAVTLAAWAAWTARQPAPAVDMPTRIY